ncbi:GNAT family N-acetyltransferase [Actinomadura sp. HBU206391]|uniref:GNAT family N-acetyltransferase n=1 Tax=Actinomadura sp. HBU206391 TaxID=2731692 RepID=UPI0016507C82|nr:GNAT family N-acetyltransferase [Actinomadura sp. HBU206391]MBC6457608.1 GNAT family N-acetyltransferase [Actinomadura sp. HBU206391]
MTAQDSTENGFPPAIQISGNGLHLREWADDDLPVLVELFDEPQIHRWTPLSSPFDLAVAQAYLSKAREDRTAGRGIQLAITSDGRNAQGEILLFRPDADDHEVELAYGIGARHRRQRLAARAVELMTAYAYDVLAMRRVVLRIDPENLASVAVARATGFRLTGDHPVIKERDGRRVSLLTWCHHREPDQIPSS